MAKKFKIGKSAEEIIETHKSKEGQERKQKIDDLNEALAYSSNKLVRFEGDWKIGVKLAIIFIVGIFVIAFILLIPEISKLANYQKTLQNNGYVSAEEHDLQMKIWNEEATAKQLILKNQLRKIQGESFMTEEEANIYTNQLTDAIYQNKEYDFTLIFIRADGSQFDYSFERDGDDYYMFTKM